MNFGGRAGAVVLIVDDLEVNRAVLEAIIQDMGCRPVLAESGEEALKAVGECRPELVLSDISMPGMDGYELCRILKGDERTKNIPIIFISAFDDPKDIVRGLTLGGEDYITKPFPPAVLLAHITVVLKRTGRWKEEPVLEHRGVELDLAKGQVRFQGVSAELTKNELRILQVLMENKEKVVARDTLMTKLWESDSYVDENTLSVNVNRLRKKLESAGLSDFIQTKKGIGYRIG